MIEVWADIVGFNGFYQISSLGNARTCLRLGGKGYRWINGCPWRPIKTTKNKMGYFKLNLRTQEGKSIYYMVHRLVWETFNGPVPEGLTVDHIDRNKADCSLNNLRLATWQQQTWNRKKETGKCYSKYKGVAFSNAYPPKPWIASIHVRGKRIYLGHFATEEEAGKAYDIAADARRGEFACTNNLPKDIVV